MEKKLPMWKPIKMGDTQDGELAYPIHKIEKKEFAAWSEEDEEISEAIIKRIKGESEALSVSLSSAISWVGNIKDRVQHQYNWKPSNEHYELEEFAKIVRSNLTGISKAVQKLFEAKYLQLTGNKMYGGFKD